MTPPAKRGPGRPRKTPDPPADPGLDQDVEAAAAALAGDTPPLLPDGLADDVAAAAGQPSPLGDRLAELYDGNAAAAEPDPLPPAMHVITAQHAQVARYPAQLVAAGVASAVEGMGATWGSADVVILAVGPGLGLDAARVVAAAIIAADEE